ncbi:MAG: PAS domain-containing protein, partial [Candidatus Rokubacteria bacterium]|nr:PAS domain-containing protein [Candidatus Rokubacteria bacterium]
MTARLDYEALLAGLPDAVVGVDEGLRIVLWNPAAEALLGRSARRVLGRTLKDVFPPDTSLVRHLTGTLTTGERRSESEAALDGGDGRPIHVSVMTAPLASRSGAVEAAVAVIRDMTRLHQLEAEVRRGETLAAVGRMAMGLAHEIRNPLSAIRGAVQLMQRELGDDGRFGEYTEVLLNEVNRVNRIIEMLLDLGRPVTLRLAPLNLHQLLERVALLSQEMAAQQGVQIIRRYDPSL